MMNVGTYFNRYRPGILFYWGKPITKKTGCLMTAGTDKRIWLELISYSSGNPEY